jgi:putative membrane protein
MEQQTGDPRTALAGERTDMAKFRTQLALDRTTLAWVRTALAMGTFGFGTIGFFRTLREKYPTPEAIHMHQGAIFFGEGLVVLGLAATLSAAVSAWFTLRKLRHNETPAVSQWPLSIIIAMMLAIVGFGALWLVWPH